MLPLLLSLQVKTSETAQILFAYCLVNSCTSSNSLSIIVCGIGPPVGLSFDISENHVLNGCRKTRDFPRNVSFPAPPSLTKMLQNGLSLIGFYTLRHHVIDIHDYRSSKLEIILRLYPLFGDSLGYTFGMSALELSRQKVSEPSL